MAYFRVLFKVNARMEALLGVLSDHDGTVYFNVDDVSQFVPKSLHQSTLLRCRPLEEVVIDPKFPKNMLMMTHRDILDTLRYLPWRISRAVTRTLEYGYFRDRPYNYNLNPYVVSSCEWGEGVEFLQWIEDLKKDYGLA